MLNYKSGSTPKSGFDGFNTFIQYDLGNLNIFNYKYNIIMITGIKKKSLQRINGL